MARVKWVYHLQTNWCVPTANSITTVGEVYQRQVVFTHSESALKRVTFPLCCNLQSAPHSALSYQVEDSSTNFLTAEYLVHSGNLVSPWGVVTNMGQHIQSLHLRHWQKLSYSRCAVVLQSCCSAIAVPHPRYLQGPLHEAGWAWKDEQPQASHSIFSLPWGEWGVPHLPKLHITPKLKVSYVTIPLCAVLYCTL
jgi:hypothetical protein